MLRRNRAEGALTTWYRRLRRASRFMTSPVIGEPSSTTAEIGDRRQIDGRERFQRMSAWRRGARRPPDRSSAPHRRRTRTPRRPRAPPFRPAGRIGISPPGCLVKRQPLATIQGLRVGEATPARAVTPGAGSASREADPRRRARSVEKRTFGRCLDGLRPEETRAAARGGRA